MANYNKVILVGNLTRDPQLSYTANNLAVAEFGIAVNHRRKGPDGQMKEEAMFIDCKVFDKRAETFSQYMTKGQPVLIEGRLELRQWQSQDGQKRSKHGVIVENFQFLGGPREGSGGNAGPRRAPQQQAAPANEEQPGPDYGAPEASGPADDIPF
jgi:single-strand DNA-binding protein